jgi:ligand-binding sensor domain-containing protein
MTPMNLGPGLSRKLILLLVLAAAGTLSAAAFVFGTFWNASRALDDSAARLSAESEIPFTVRTLGAQPASTQDPTAAPIAAPSGAFERLASAGTYRDAAILDGHIFLAGPSGIWEYAPGGRQLNEYLVGADLPSAEPTRMAAGLARGAPGSVLYVVTSGEGLLIYDPKREAFTQIRADERRFRDLTAVLPLTTGQVLLGTGRDGVLVYDGEQLAPFHPAIAKLQVTALAGNETELWVGTLDRGVIRFRAGESHAFSEPDGLPDPQVLSIAANETAAYVGTPIGVAEFKSGEFARTLADGFFANSLLVHGNRLVIGTLDEGVVEVPLDVRRSRGPIHAEAGQLAGTPIARLIEAGGQVMAVAAGGLYRLGAQPGEEEVLRAHEALLSDRNISALSFDPSGRLWVGYFDRGLDIVDLASGQSRHIENEHVFCVNRITHDTARDRTAVATANGLVLFDLAGRQQEVLGREQGLISSHVTDVVVQGDAMTVATPAGITFLDARGARSLYAFHGLVNNHVYALGASGDRLLAGTLGGLSVLDAGVIQAAYTTANSALEHNWITAIVPIENEWFVGTYGAGVLKLTANNTWQGFPVATGAFEINPNAMLATPERVYAGSLGCGLYVYEKAADRWTTIVDGLPSDNVTALAVRDGYLYVGTTNGIVRAREDGLPGLSRQR